MNEVETLRERIAILEERIHQIEQVLKESAAQFPSLELTPTQQKIFGILFKNDFVTTEQLITIIFNGKEELADPITVRTHIYFMRKKLVASNMQILNRRGFGYYLKATTQLE